MGPAAPPAGWRARIAQAGVEFEQACRDPVGAQEATFRRILEQARASAFGREHGLDKVNDWREFRSAVPARSSTELQVYTRRMVAGEPDVLFPGHPVFIGKTSGTTASSKYICYPPGSHDTMWRHLGAWLDQFSPDELDQGFFFAGRYREDVTAGGVVVGSSTGFVRHALDEMPWFRAVPASLYDLADHQERYCAFLRFLLLQSLRVLCTPNPSTIITLLEQFKTNRSRLVDDLESGHLDPSYAALAPTWPTVALPRPDVAARLRALPPEVTLSDLWPQLKKIATWHDGGTALYYDRLQAAAPEAELVRAPSGATEGLMLTRGWAPADGCCPSLLCSFLEFAPPDGDSNDTLMAGDLELGQTARLILTSERGMYRCRTDDLYQVVGRHHATPRLRYVGRSELVSSLTGEKLSEPQVIAAIRSLADVLGPMAGVQLTPVWDDPPRYALVIEPMADAALPNERRDLVLARLEAALRSQNDEYAYKRDSLRLGTPILVIVERGDFARQQQRQAALAGRSDAQTKVPVLSKELLTPERYRVRERYPAADARSATDPATRA